MTLPALRQRLILVSLLGLIFATVLFLSAPQIDLTVSAFFADPIEGGFPVSRDPFWKAVRSFFILTTDGAVLVVLGLLLRNLLRSRRGHLNTRAFGFLVAAYVIGPGLVVNGLFKGFWGRARPRNIIAFGGPHQFSPPVIPADQCAHNCSFVSGEASSAATLALALLLLFWLRLDGRGRIAASCVAAVYVGVASGLRIAFGAHFLSDTIFAVLMMGLLVPVVHRVFFGDA